MFGLSVNHAYAGPGIFINDGTDDGCVWIFDKEGYSPIGDYFGGTVPTDKDSAGRNSPASVKYYIPSIQQLGGAATLKCLSKDRDTQVDRVLLYGKGKEQGSISLTLGGELFVNNGNLGLGGGAGTKAMRIGSMATLTGPSGLRSLAIGAGKIATVASGGDAIAIGTAAQAAYVGSIALGLQSTTELPSKDVTILVNGIKLSAFAGSNPVSVLSIGNDTLKRSITNVGAGRVSKDSTDAVNGSQLYAVAEQATLGWNLTANGTDKSRVSPGGTVDLSNSDGNFVIGKRGAGVTFNLAPDLKVTSLVAGNTFLDTNGLVITGGPSMTVSGIDAGQLKISHVADGAVTVTSTDAVNGSQLHRVAHTIAEHLGGDAHVNADGSVIGPQYTVQKKRYKTIYDAFGGVDENLANINDILHDIESGGGIKYFHGNSIGADSRALGTNSIAVGSDSVASGEGSISVGNGAQASAHSSVALGENAAALDANSVALGAGSKTSEVVATKGTTINGQYYDFAGDAPSGTVSVGDKGAERTITNVAAGRISVESTDAVNGSQLNAVNQAIENLAAGVTENDKFSVKYDRHSDGTKKNSMTLQGWDSATPVVLANVADGVHKNDAVNVSQLKAGLSTTLGEAKAYTDQTALQTLDQANAYTDKKFGKLNEDIVATRIEARQAAAIGLAAASLRYDDRPGKISAAIGGGFWSGEGAVALGLGHTSEDQRMRSNLSVATSGGNWGMEAGFSYVFN
ncbi:YadA-like family protein [Brucella ovis]|uniref:YadA-like family protein n=1 Tax=Brucella ovis TaxID=236 RepID=UPI00046D8403|nr:YadA-like family protein [Brucella ovis]